MLEPNMKTFRTFRTFYVRTKHENSDVTTTREIYCHTDIASDTWHIMDL